MPVENVDEGRDIDIEPNRAQPRYEAEDYTKLLLKESSYTSSEHVTDRYVDFRIILSP
jgi:hypothetical protein